MLSNLDGHQHALNEYMGRELFMFCLVSKALNQISFSIWLINTIRRALVIILFIIKSMYSDQTIKRNEPAPHSDAFLGQWLLSLTLHGWSTALNCAITTVQYHRTILWFIVRSRGRNGTM